MNHTVRKGARIRPGAASEGKIAPEPALVQCGGQPTRPTPGTLAEAPRGSLSAWVRAGSTGRRLILISQGFFHGGRGSAVDDAARRAAEVLIAARGRAFAFTGAGVSTESGIPDFRGPSGLWKRIPPEVFSIEYFFEYPGEAWRLYSELYAVLRSARPNPAHHALARLEKLGVIEAVVTQNIDGLHQAAGSRVVELHGTAGRAVCLSCGARYPVEEALRVIRRGDVPRCPRCGGLLKPDAVFFGEPLPEEALAEAFRLASRARAVLVVGTSLQVYPAALVPEEAARRGARLVIVNLEPTPLDWRAEVVVRESAARFLPRLVEEVERLLSGKDD